MNYGNGESVTLLSVQPGVLSAHAKIRMVFIDHTQHGEPLVTREATVPLEVRWTHPAFFLQHVAFLPS